MAESNCPLCYTELIKKQVTPCMECGGDEMELNHFTEHNYKEYEVFFGQKLILCNFCDVDFGSYDPTHFGFEKGKKIGYEYFDFVRDIMDKDLKMDKYCPNCKCRLPFLKFVENCRVENKNGTQHSL